ncbi:MAG: hypothetical protein AAF493_29585 [Pseudomonadota bacterium]
MRSVHVRRPARGSVLAICAALIVTSGSVLAQSSETFRVELEERIARLTDRLIDARSENDGLKRLISSLQADLTAALTDAEESKTALNEANKELGENKETLKKMRREMEAMSGDVADGSIATERQKRMAEQLKSELASAQEESSSLGRITEGLKARLTEGASSLRLLNDELTDVTAARDKLSEAKAALETKLESVGKDLSERVSALADVSKVRDAIKKTLETTKASLGERDRELSAMTTARDELAVEKSKLELTLNRSKEENDTLATKGEQLMAQLQTATTKGSDLATQLETATARGTDLTAQLEAATAKGTDLASQLEVATTEKTGLTEEVGALTSKVSDWTAKFEESQGLLEAAKEKVSTALRQRNGFGVLLLVAIGAIVWLWRRGSATA